MRWTLLGLVLPAALGLPHVLAQTTVETQYGCGGHWISSAECQFEHIQDPVAFGGFAESPALATITVQVVRKDFFGGEQVLAECTAAGLFHAECGDLAFTGAFQGEILTCRVTGIVEGLYGCQTDPPYRKIRP